MLDQTPIATNASALDKENYARAYLVLYGVSIVRFFLVIENATLAVITIFHLSGVSSKRTKFPRLFAR